MNNAVKIVLSLLLATSGGMGVASAGQADMQAAPVAQASGSTAQQPGLQPVVVLEDRLHQIRQTLSSAAEVHHYQFSSIRGQDVLISIPGSAGYGTL